MKVRLTRNIHHHTPETGLTRTTVFKDYNWDIPPVIGATVDDVAWHRNDIVTIENINIISEEADSYHIELTYKEVDNIDEIDKLVDIVKLHGWKVLY